MISILVKLFDNKYFCSLRAQDIVFIGLRDALPCEVVFFRKYGIAAFTMKEVDQLGIKEVSHKPLENN